MAQRRIAPSMFDIRLLANLAALVSFGVTLTILTFVPVAQAQTFQVLHTFTGADGAYPYGTLARDRGGNLYGTTYSGGTGCNGHGCGTVFKLTHKNSGWVLTRLYSFQGGMDGSFPTAGVALGPDGSLYGTTSAGGGGACAPPTGGTGCGTVFNLKPAARNCGASACPWIESVLHRFAGGSDGAFPGFGNLTFDSAGNLYGTTTGDYSGNDGTVFQFSRLNGSWVQTILHSFTQGEQPYSGVVLDGAGNVYGTAAGADTVYELKSSQGWLYQPLYLFQFGGSGDTPTGGLAFDSAGNLYGTTLNNGGSAYQLHPSQGQWTFTNLQSFNAYQGAFDAPTVDASGNVYGTVNVGPPGVFKLTPSGGGWIQTDLHDFSAGADGDLPVAGVIVDSSGNLYGATTAGGNSGCSCGVIFEITQ